jgi:hypothetical protein
MAKAGNKPTPRLSLVEIFQQLRRRDTSVPEATMKTTILRAYRAGLPLTAAKVCRWVTLPVRPPDVWMDEPAPDDEDGWKHLKEMRKTRIVSFTEKVLLEGVDSLGPFVVHASRVPPPPANRVIEEITYDEQIPVSIPPAAIRFNWVDSSAVWTNKETGVITEFFGITASRDGVEREWPAAAVLSPQQWVGVEIARMKAAGDVQAGIGKRALARILKPRLDDAHVRGLVRHSMKLGAICNALGDEQWGVWPVT